MTAGCKGTTSCPARGSTAGTTPTTRSACSGNSPGLSPGSGARRGPWPEGGSSPPWSRLSRLGPQDPPDSLALRDLPPDLQRFINDREAQVQPTLNVEEETADHSAWVEADSVSASEHSPQPLNTGTHALRAPPQVQEGMRQTTSRSSYDCGGWSTRPGWAVSRIRLYSYSMRVPLGRLQHHQGSGLLGTLP